MTIHPMPQAGNLALAWTYVEALTGADPAIAIIDVRMIHDRDASTPAQSRRGTLPELWPWIEAMQAEGYGAFVAMQELDGAGREAANLKAIRCHAVDLDGADAQQQYERAAVWNPPPSFAVATSPGRCHVYWTVRPYTSADLAGSIQRRLAGLFNADRAVVDMARVLRLPGSLHLKNPAQPYLVTWCRLDGFGKPIDRSVLEIALYGVPDHDSGGDRHPLGDPTLAAPSIEWLQYGLSLIDPNTLDRSAWIATLAAAKQSAWTLAPPDQVQAILMQWCSRYDGDNPAEDAKQIASLRNTELGWSSLVCRVPALQAALMFGGQHHGTPASPSPQPTGDYLTGPECAQWFAGCVLVGPENVIIDAKGQEYGQGAFASAFGGKRFIITTNGTATDDAWKAATRSTLWTVPKVDGKVFRPDRPTGDITTDELKRRYVNTYIPARIERQKGDASPFLKHFAAMFPDAGDRRVLLDYMAHNAKYPGHKIPWAPLIQSAEGTGKNIIKYVMVHVIGAQYVYPPNAKELAVGGGKFNDWMRNRLFLIADEIKTDERREMVEILKPMISETTLEMQGKGRDQRKADNVANWLFFSNHKDAIPIHSSGRRFAILYSAIQSRQDLFQRGMDDRYFNWLYDDWLGERTHKTGLRIVADMLLSHPIERGAITMRAPHTSSQAEAIEHSRGWLERLVLDGVEEARNGFRDGWINTAAVGALARASGREEPQAVTIGKAIDACGYHRIGQASRGHLQDDSRNPNKRGVLWNRDRAALPANYGRAQGYE